MKRPLLKTALLCATAFMLTACNSATTGSAQEASLAAPAEKVGGDAPAMWRLADEDSEVVLFGTFHVLPADLEWTTPAFDAAMAETAATFTEADVSSPEAQAALGALVQQYGLNPPGVTLSSIMGAERFAQLSAVATEIGIPPQALEAQRPWLAMISLTAIAMQKEGYAQAAGAEALIEARAKAEGDEIGFLETAEFQIRQFANIPDEDILGNFDQTLEQLADLPTYLDRMLQAWSTGDVEDLDEGFFKPMKLEAPVAYDALLVTRNKNWVEKIDEMMAGEGDYFIAVGAGHLVGEDSVIAMLRARGYDVTRVQ